MPRQLTELSQFLTYAAKPDARAVRIKRNVVRSKDGKPTTVTKFKLRCSRFLYTLTLLDKDKADKLRQSLPPGLTVDEVKKSPKKK